VKPQLLEDVRDVGLDGRLADVELLPDLRVGESVGDEAKRFLLTGGEFVEFFLVGVCGGRRLAVAVVLADGLVHHPQHRQAAALAEVAHEEDGGE
jgi:hypothetical protein